jgi:hypothetical protein
MSGPNIQDIPLLLGCLPLISVGSDHRQSTMIPSSPGSFTLRVFLISSSFMLSFANSPPCVTKTFALMQ